MKKIIILSLLSISTIGLSQTMRISYFRASETKDNIKLYWETFVEDGVDTFKIYRSINSEECDYSEDNWEFLASLPNNNKKNGQYYSVDLPLEPGKRYYRIVWGVYKYKLYSTLTVKNNETFENIYYSNSSIIIENKKFESKFNIYDVTGTLIFENIENGHNVTNLPKNLYIVINVNTGRFIKFIP